MACTFTTANRGYPYPCAPPGRSHTKGKEGVCSFEVNDLDPTHCSNSFYKNPQGYKKTVSPVSLSPKLAPWEPRLPIPPSLHSPPPPVMFSSTTFQPDPAPWAVTTAPDAEHVGAHAHATARRTSNTNGTCHLLLNSSLVSANPSPGARPLPHVTHRPQRPPHHFWKGTPMLSW